MTPEQGHLAEVLTCLQRADHLRLPRRSSLQHLDLTGEDHVQAVTRVALVEDDLARLIVGLRRAAPATEVELDGVGREHEVAQPRDGDAGLAAGAREL